ncbi:11059_t:CDS:2 [Diversispora eburnea]|uniref:11059_t:CDS:1 n=1 Tax=Diversispora eburnea TaxID=1213867 RepID=A0A9N9AD91_9GLOM|nr:11059_t:CDS:2 [Diversispora eburnea]
MGISYSRKTAATNVHSKRGCTIDDDEIDRSQIIHHVLRCLWESNFKAPVPKIENAKILDIGCRSGTWAFDMVSDFPNCHVTGIEIAPVMFTQTPRNVRLISVESFDQGFPFEDNSFDFIHMRFCWVYFTHDQWRNTVLDELGRILKPGGWLEIVDFTVGGVNMGPMTIKLVQNVITEFTSRGTDPFLDSHLLDLLKSHPKFTSESHQIKNVPCGDWGGNIGIDYARYIRLSIYKSMEAMPSKARKFKENMDNIFLEIQKYHSSSITNRFIAQKKVEPPLSPPPPIVGDTNPKKYQLYWKGDESFDYWLESSYPMIFDTNCNDSSNTNPISISRIDIIGETRILNNNSWKNSNITFITYENKNNIATEINNSFDVVAYVKGSIDHGFMFYENDDESGKLFVKTNQTGFGWKLKNQR